MEEAHVSRRSADRTEECEVTVLSIEEEAIIIAHRLIDMTDLLRSVGARDNPFSKIGRDIFPPTAGRLARIPHARADEGGLKVRTRDFR